MKHPEFASLKEARAWLVPRVIDDAATPFRDILTGAAYEELLEFLDDLASTHPRMRKYATRASTSLLPKKIRKLAEAAREDEDDVVVPIAARPKVPELPAGAVDLANPELHKDSLAVIRTLARKYEKKSTLSFDDLVGEGWVVAVEVSKTWKSTKKAAWRTFLWTCVRRHMRDQIRKGMNRLETPISHLWVEKATDGDLNVKDDDVDDFQEGMNAAATAFTLGMTNESALPADGRLSRAREAARIKEAIENLPARQRKLIELVYYDQLPMNEVADKLGMADRNMRVEHAKALKALHKKLAASTNVRPLKPRK